VEYAGWISPKFRILVNQTFIDYRTGKLQPQPPTVKDPLLQAIVTMAQKLDAVQEKQSNVIKAIKSEIKKRKKTDAKVAELAHKLESIRTASVYFTIIGYVKYAWKYDDNRLRCIYSSTSKPTAIFANEVTFTGAKKAPPWITSGRVFCLLKSRGGG
jgi:hypothetical protein